MKRKPKVGFLPLYILTYDESTPFMRKTVDLHVREVGERLEALGLDLVKAPICRVRSEFEAAVSSFTEADVDLIITLHAAYSPSLESIDALCSVKTPLLMLDTTYNYEFKPYSYTEGMLYNHGIHGVMDLCNLLRRRGRQYEVVAGFFNEANPDYAALCRRVTDFAKAAVIRHTLAHARVGIVGEPFEGMGDFRIPFDTLKEKLGLEVVPYDLRDDTYLDAVTQAEIDAEYADNAGRFEMAVPREVYDFSTRVSLAVRKWLADRSLNAFSMNFKAAETGTSFPTMPFAEASLAMERGIGYAGEGDVLTAAFVASLMEVFDAVSFTEIFCPDWKDGTLFLSHMGEYNVGLSVPEAKPVMREKEFSFGNAANPAILLSPFRPGRVTFLSLNPSPDDSFELFTETGSMLYTPRDNKQNDIVSGWFRPDQPLPEFLETYSRAGGMHHAALIYSDTDISGVLNALKTLL